jgi:hypothetical protein
MSDLTGGMFRSHWSSKLLVEVVGECEMRIGSSIKRAGIIYRRIDAGKQDDEPLTVRPLAEFLHTFERQE